MFQFLSNFISTVLDLPGQSDQGLTVESYCCDSKIKLPRRIKTALGSKVQVIRVWVDIRYRVDNEQIILDHVTLSRKGGTINGNAFFNVSAVHTGEAWQATEYIPTSLLKNAVQSDLDDPNSSLRRIMYGIWRRDNCGEQRKTLIDGINSHLPPEQIEELIQSAG